MNNRTNRAQSAQQTLDIIEQGFYTINNKKVDISKYIENSINKTCIYSPQDFKSIIASSENIIREKQIKSRLSVQNSTSMEAAEDLLKTGGKIGCLNFASAKNPGGGFLGGSQAQEESLSRASTLYPTQMKYFSEMYEYNRKQNTYLYSDYMIYSPAVIFLKNDLDELLETPYQLDVLTSPAVNIGAMKKNNPKELQLAEQTMMSRIDKILSIFVLHEVDSIVLGAWGCGVFQNDPNDIARYFATYLKGDGKYAKCFKNIIFAVLDRSKNQENIQAFQNVFE